MPASSRAEFAFDAYVEMGPDWSLASLRGVLQGRMRRPPSLRTLESWSARFDWQARLQELERRVQEQAERERLEALGEYRRRLREEGLVLQQRGLEWLRDKRSNDVRAHEGIRAIEAGFRLEALALGEATERIILEERDERLERLSDEELERLITVAQTRDPGGTQ